MPLSNLDSLPQITAEFNKRRAPVTVVNGYPVMHTCPCGYSGDLIIEKVDAIRNRQEVVTVHMCPECWKMADILVSLYGDNGFLLHTYSPTNISLSALYSCSIAGITAALRLKRNI